MSEQHYNLTYSIDGEQKRLEGITWVTLASLLNKLADRLMEPDGGFDGDVHIEIV